MYPDTMGIVLYFRMSFLNLTRLNGLKIIIGIDAVELFMPLMGLLLISEM